MTTRTHCINQEMDLTFAEIKLPTEEINIQLERFQANRMNLSPLKLPITICAPIGHNIRSFPNKTQSARRMKSYLSSPNPSIEQQRTATRANENIGPTKPKKTSHHFSPPIRPPTHLRTQIYLQNSK